MPQYIAVDGPIGVGKSSLVQLLARDFGATQVLEEPDANPFLPSFYDDPARYAFQTQLNFLLSRYRQQLDLKQVDLFQQRIVCDYVFPKDILFAELNLSEEEFDLYQQIYQMLDQRLPKPDVVIFLQAKPEVLLKRVKKRDIDYESSIDVEYLTKVSQAYSQFFFQYQDCPVLVVNTSVLDFVSHLNDYELLKGALMDMLESGQQKHFVTIDPR